MGFEGAVGPPPIFIDPHDLADTGSVHGFLQECVALALACRHPLRMVWRLAVSMTR